MSVIDLVVVGAIESVQMLQSGADALSGEQAGLALVSGAQLVANAWKADAPVLTGTYRRSIHVGDPTPTEVRVGTDVPYGKRLEYGFNGTDALGRTYHQPAGGYARRAMDENREAVTQEVRNAIVALLRAGAA
jgi:hypothetical protein